MQTSKEQLSVVSHPLVETLLFPKGNLSPPQIERFSFECQSLGYAPPVGISGQFHSYHELSGDRDSSPDRSEDGDSEFSSRGPSTPTADDSPSLPPASRLLLTPLNKSPDDSFSLFNTSPTLASGPHSLTLDHSLSHDTPSYLGLRIGVPPHLRHSSDSIMDSPTKHYADLKPFSAHTSLPTHITTPAQQTTRAEEAQPAKTARRSRMSANRGITVHKLALELPQACSPSNSLSTFINALEDASPGWYQSLMDSALPHSGSYSPLASPQSSSSFSKSLTESVGSGTSLPKDGLPCDMLGAMRELEELATAVRHLPIPTLRTVVVDWVVSPLTPDVSTTPASERKHLTLPPVTSTSSTLIRPGERKSAPAVRSKEVLRETLPSDYRAPSAYAPSPNQPAIDNLVYHPKLSKTLGLRSLPSWGASGTAAPQTPTPQGGFDGGLHSPQSYWEDCRSPSGKDLPTSVERLPENHLPSKTPKSYKIASFFRRRPTAAAVVEDWPEYRRDPALRATHVPESVPRVLRSAPDGPANKGSSRSSPILEPPPSLGHRQLDSFLQM